MSESSIVRSWLLDPSIYIQRPQGPMSLLNEVWHGLFTTLLANRHSVRNALTHLVNGLPRALGASKMNTLPNPVTCYSSISTCFGNSKWLLKKPEGLEMFTLLANEVKLMFFLKRSIFCVLHFFPVVHL